jgi:hypothetical protein
MMRPRASEPSSSFPWWVALASLGFVLLLFFTNTVPALRDRQSLRDVQQELVGLRRQYDDAIRAASLGLGPRSNYDLQSLLVAIDQQGFTPLELCAAYPMSERAGEPADPAEPEPR